MKHIVLSILAHVDAGKTTLIESLLYTAGTIRRPGRVDKQTTVLDDDIQERERGITIYAKEAGFAWRDTGVQVIDTPCLLYTSPSPRDGATSRMPSSA